MSYGSSPIPTGRRAQHGETREPDHPEGSVTAHIEDVLANVDRVALDEADRERLRFVALRHDTFKNHLRFYRADNETGSKDQTPLQWFERDSGE